MSGHNAKRRRQTSGQGDVPQQGHRRLPARCDEQDYGTNAATAQAGRHETDPNAHARASDGGGGGDDEGPACLSCRRRKSRCSKQQPCLQCERLAVECLYDDAKRRPGIKTGAVEALSQRLSNLEHMFLGQGLLLRQLLDTNRSNADSNSSDRDHPLDERVEQVKRRCLQAADTLDTAVTMSPAGAVEPSALLDAGSASLTEQSQDHASPALPARQILDQYIKWYFENAHRWIPILHQERFLATLHDKQKAKCQGFNNVLMAIVSIAMKFCNPAGAHAVSAATGLNYRQAVILRGMEKFSVESLQALVIIAFDILGEGQGPSAWSVIGSMARTVEQLRLNAEESAGTGSSANPRFLMRRLTFLRPSRDWVEEEERRRLFWAIFMMDRFCSIATGWNNSLTLADVRRRLPCEGSIWRACTPVSTPFFGDALLGAPLMQAATWLETPSSINGDQINAIGGFAYCLEATETLNFVTTFFLQHAVEFQQPLDVQAWMIRFKELDLRLIKWRQFLPEQWRNASAPNRDGILDPNLVLAHITHNTAVIQLHQCVAYPPPQLRNHSIQQLSATSANTCLCAATEIGTIAEHFLDQSQGLVTPQMALCLFVAGRLFLTHALSTSLTVHEAFETISNALLKVASRWQADGCTENLASRLSSKLLQAQASLSKRAGSHDVECATLDLQRPVYFDYPIRSRAVSVSSDKTGGAANELQDDPLKEMPQNHGFTQLGTQYSISDPDFMAFTALPHLDGEACDLTNWNDYGNNARNAVPGGHEASNMTLGYADLINYNELSDFELQPVFRVSQFNTAP